MICRLCLDEAEHSVPIFDQDEAADFAGASTNLAGLIEKHLQMVVSGDGWNSVAQMFTTVPIPTAPAQ